MTKTVELALDLLNHWQGCLANMPEKEEMLQNNVDKYISILHRNDTDVRLNARDNTWSIIEDCS